MPAFPVAARDATGAGDAFCGALAVAVARGLPAREAVRWANAAGALAVTVMGANLSMPTAERLEAFLVEQARK
jgi:ribokinase